MTYYYQVTNTRNLASIKLHGRAPWENRPASVAQEATAEDRISSENDIFERVTRRFLLLVLKEGYRIEKILSIPAPELALEAPLITGEIDYSTEIPGRKDNIWLTENDEKYLTAYRKILG